MDGDVLTTGRPSGLTPESSRTTLWLIGVLLLGFLLRAVFMSGPVGSDDTMYMDAARLLTQGRGPPTLDNSYVRGAWLLWLAALVKLGGGTYLMVRAQVLIGTALIGAVYWVATMFTDSAAATFAAFCWAVFPVELVYGGMVLPDQLGLLLALVAAGFALKGLDPHSPVRTWTLVIAGVCTGLAVSVKEPFFLLPIIFALWGLIRGLPLRQLVARVMILGVVAVAVFALEYPFFKLWTGDWLYRHHALAAAYGPNGFALYTIPGKQFLYYSLDVIVNPAVVGLFGWAIAASLVSRTMDRKALLLVLAWSLAFFFFLQFGSASLTRYQPLPKQARYVQPMVVLLFIPLGIWMRKLGSVAMLRGAPAVLLLAGLGWHSIAVAAERASMPIYKADLPRSVLALRKAQPGLVATLLAEDYATLPQEIRDSIRDWPRISNPGSASNIRLLVPRFRFAQLDSVHYTQSEPIEYWHCPLDRAFHVLPGPLKRFAHTIEIGRLVTIP